MNICGSAIIHNAQLELGGYHRFQLLVCFNSWKEQTGFLTSDLDLFKFWLNELYRHKKRVETGAQTCNSLHGTDTPTVDSLTG